VKVRDFEEWAMIYVMGLVAAMVVWSALICPVLFLRVMFWALLPIPLGFIVATTREKRRR
jgi:hypothetical protein